MTDWLKMGFDNSFDKEGVLVVWSCPDCKYQFCGKATWVDNEVVKPVRYCPICKNNNVRQI